MSDNGCQMCRAKAFELAADPAFVAVATRYPNVRVFLCDGCRGAPVFGSDTDSTYAPVGYVPDPAAVQADQALLGAPGLTGTSRGMASVGLATPRVTTSPGGASTTTGSSLTLSTGSPPAGAVAPIMTAGGNGSDGYLESGAAPTSWSGSQIVQPPFPTAPAAAPPPVAPPALSPVPLVSPDLPDDEGPQSVPEADARLAGVGSIDTGDDTPDDDDEADSNPDADFQLSGLGGGAASQSRGGWVLLGYGRQQKKDRKWAIALIVGLILLLIFLAKRHKSAEPTDPTGVQPEYA